jgi:hypothetical protein
MLIEQLSFSPSGGRFHLMTLPSRRYYWSLHHGRQVPRAPIHPILLLMDRQRWWRDERVFQD